MLELVGGRRFDKALKLILSELLKTVLEAEAVEVGRGMVAKELEADVFVAGPRPRRELPEGSWLRFVLERAARYIIIEAKHAGSYAMTDYVVQILAYRFALAKELGCAPGDVTAVLIVSRLSERFAEKLRSRVSPELKVSGSGGLYVVGGVKALEVLVIAVDELDPDVEYNEVLCIFSTSEETSRRAAINILSKYPPSTFIYAFTIIYKPEVSRMAEVDLIPSEKLRMALEAFGPAKLAEALGPDGAVQLIEVLGPDRIAEALGPEKLSKLILALARSLPEEERRKLAEVIANGRE